MTHDILIDTHAFIWWATNQPQLSERAARAIDDQRTKARLSAVTPWEIALLIKRRRLDNGGALLTLALRLIEEGELAPLAITHEHGAAIASLPVHHGDPFDRMLVAQAITHGLALVSKDEALDAYGVERIW